MSEHYDDYEAKMQLAERAWEEQEARRNFRTEVWTTKDGREIAIKDMEDGHLLNAYKHSQNGLLFREMVLRLFEESIIARNRPWIGLSDEEALDCWPGLAMYADCVKFWENIEAKLKAKNEH